MKEITPAQKITAMRVIQPMLDVIAQLTPEEMKLAMEGFYNATEDNCPWQLMVLRHALPPMISISAEGRGIDLIEYFSRTIQ